MTALLNVEGSTVSPPILPHIGRVTSPQYAPMILSSDLYVPRPGIEAMSLRMSIPDFNVSIDGTIVELRQDETAGRIFIKVALDASVDEDIVFAGTMTGGGTSLQIEEVSFRLAPSDNSARADFIASTLNAALTLSDQVHFQVPEISLDLTLRFDQPLIEIGRMLQSRQTSQRLMTIERATGVRLNLPPDGFSGTEIAAITFAFRAIIDRAFTYHLINGIPILVEANDEGAKQVSSLEPGGTAFGPEEMSKRFLGVEIQLGKMTVKVLDPYIVDIDRVRQEIANGDGHPVNALIRSATNQALFELPEAPCLPPTPWDSRIQALIDLEKELDSRLVERYHSLAASTLAGLTDTERKRVTARVELDEETFFIDDAADQDS